MVDDKSLRGSQDRSRIALGEDDGVAYWTDGFGVSREQLAQAVGGAGNRAAVEQHLCGR